VNEFEKLLYEKWNKSLAGMEIWSIENITGSNPKVRVNNVMMDSNPEMLPCS